MNDNIDIKIIKNYQIIKKVGKGAYGQVWKCLNKKKKYICALKRIFDAFRNITDCQHTYRQIMYLKQLQHPNIIRIFNYQKSLNERDMYIEMQFVQSDLLTALKNQYLKDIQKQYIFTQCVAGIYYLHSGNLIHRDIKPSNILVGSNCEAKLCDFGLIRGLSSYQNQSLLKLTDNIATRWYKAPQLLLSSCNYGKQIDIWSLGCLLAELYLSKPLFQGTSTFNQLQKIIQITGIPAVDKLSEIIHSQTSLAVLRSFINDCSNIGGRHVYPMQTKTKRQSLCYLSTSQSKQQPLQSQQSVSSNYKRLLQIIPSINTPSNNHILDLLTKMLQFDPRKRLKIEQIIQHPYLSKFKNKVQFTKLDKIIKIKYQNTKLTVEQYKKLLNNKMRVSNNFVGTNATGENQNDQTMLGRKLSNDKYPRRSIQRKKKSKSVNKSINGYSGTCNQHSRPKQTSINKKNIDNKKNANLNPITYTNQNTNINIKININDTEIKYNNENTSNHNPIQINNNNISVNLQVGSQNNRSRVILGTVPYQKPEDKQIIHKSYNYNNNGLYRYYKIDNQPLANPITHNIPVQIQKYKSLPLHINIQKDKSKDQQFITTYINTTYPQNENPPPQCYIQKSLKSIKSANMDTANPARIQGSNNMLYSYQDTNPNKYNGHWYSPQNSAWKQIPKQVAKQRCISISGNKSQNKSISNMSIKSNLSNNSQISQVSSKKYIKTSNIHSNNNNYNNDSNTNKHINNNNVKNSNDNIDANVYNIGVNNIKDNFAIQIHNPSINKQSNINPTHPQPKDYQQPRINRQSFEKVTNTIQQIRNVHRNYINTNNNNIHTHTHNNMNNNNNNNNNNNINHNQMYHQLPHYPTNYTKKPVISTKNQPITNINSIPAPNSNTYNQSDNLQNRKQTRKSLYTHLEPKTNIHGSNNDLNSVFHNPDFNTNTNNVNNVNNVNNYNTNPANLYQGMAKRQKVQNSPYPLYQQTVSCSAPTTPVPLEIKYTTYQIPSPSVPTATGSPKYDSYKGNNPMNFKTSLNGFSGFSPTFQNYNLGSPVSNKGNFANIINKNDNKNGVQTRNFKEWKRN